MIRMLFISIRVGLSLFEDQILIWILAVGLANYGFGLTFVVKN